MICAHCQKARLREAGGGLDLLRLLLSDEDGVEEVAVRFEPIPGGVLVGESKRPATRVRVELALVRIYGEPRSTP